MQHSKEYDIGRFWKYIRFWIDKNWTEKNGRCLGTACPCQILEQYGDFNTESYDFD